MSQKPNDQLLESMSALVDDQASELEVRRILKSAESDPDVLEKWRRYNLIGSLLRKEQDTGFVERAGFVSSISAMVDSEPDVYPTVTQKDENGSNGGQAINSVAVSGQRSAVWELVGKTSIAASFAAAVIVSANFYRLGSGAQEPVSLDSPSLALSNEPATGVEIVNPEVPTGFQLPTLEARTVSQSNSPASYFDDSRRLVVLPQADDLTDGATQEMLNQMLIYHAERASVNGGLGMMPFARVSKMHQSR